jgi:mutator family transposase
MDMENGHLIEDTDGASVAVVNESVDGAGLASKTTAASRQAAAEHGLRPELIDELAELAAGQIRGGGLRLMGEGGLLVELTRHLMQTAVEAEMDLHLAEEACRTNGRGSRSGGNARNGYRSRKVITEVGTVTVQVPLGPARHLQLRPAALVRAADRRSGGDGSLADFEGAHVRGDRRASRRDVRHADLIGDGLHHHRQSPGVEPGFRGE